MKNLNKSHLLNKYGKKSNFCQFQLNLALLKNFKSVFKSSLDDTKQDFLVVSPSIFKIIFSGTKESLKFFRSYLNNGKIASTRGTSSLSHLINSFKVHGIYIMICNYLHLLTYRGDEFASLRTTH